MTAFMLNASHGGDFAFDMTAEVDEVPFIAITFEPEGNDQSVEFQTSNPTDVEEFFRIVDLAKAEWQKIKPA